MSLVKEIVEQQLAKTSAQAITVKGGVSSAQDISNEVNGKSQNRSWTQFRFSQKQRMEIHLMLMLHHTLRSIFHIHEENRYLDIGARTYVLTPNMGDQSVWTMISLARQQFLAHL